MTSALLISENTDTVAPWQILAAELRQRDHDPAYADAPVLDAYGRISVNEETGESEKVTRQLSDVLIKLQGMHARLGMVLRDDGKSAWDVKVKRPGWDALISRLTSGASQGVVAWHLDRLLRQPRDLEKLIDLATGGIIVDTCFGKYDLSNSDGRLSCRVVTAAKVNDSDSNSRRMKRKAQAMREAGKLHGGARAFGFAGKDVSDEQVEAERKAIKAASEKIAAESDVVVADIVRQWNSDGLVTVAGKRWTAVNLRSVLCRGRNAGLLEHDGHEVGIAVDIEPIVDRDTYDAVVAAFASRKRGRPANLGNYMLSGLLRCGRCNGTMAGRPRMNGSKEYVCTTCRKTTINADAAEQWVTEQTLAIVSDPAHERNIARANAELAEIQRKLDAADRTARGLASKLGADDLSYEEWEEFRASNKRRIRKLEEERDAVRTGAGIDPLRYRHVSSAVVPFARLAGEWDDLGAGERMSLIRSAFPRGIKVNPPARSGRGLDPRDRLSPIERSQ